MSNEWIRTENLFAYSEKQPSLFLNQGQINELHQILLQSSAKAEILRIEALPCLDNGYINQFPGKGYGIGGDVLHRGYFCPSPIIDIVIGNCSRGRFARRTKKEPSFRYYFDEAGKLRLVEKEDSIEYLSDRGSVQVGVELAKGTHWSKSRGMVLGYSECRYTENLLSQYLYVWLERGRSDIHLERYEYENGILSTAELLKEHDGKQPIRELHVKFRFYHNDACIHSYGIEYPGKKYDSSSDRLIRISKSKQICITGSQSKNNHPM